MRIGYLLFKMFDRLEYIHIPFNLLLLNWVFQRAFRINSEIPFSVHYTSKVVGAKYIDIHKSVRTSFAVSGGTHIVAIKYGGIYIGENTIFAFNVCIQTINHDFIDRKKVYPKKVIIGKNCWLGNSVTILPGVTLGDNVTVGANSVVTKSFPNNVVIAGVPAKIIKKI